IESRFESDLVAKPSCARGQPAWLPGGERNGAEPNEIGAASLAPDFANQRGDRPAFARCDIDGAGEVGAEDSDESARHILDMHEVALVVPICAVDRPACQEIRHDIRHKPAGGLTRAIDEEDPAPGDAHSQRGAGFEQEFAGGTFAEAVEGAWPQW